MSHWGFRRLFGSSRQASGERTLAQPKAHPPEGPHRRYVRGVPTRALVIGLAVGVVGLALGGSVLATADTDRKLFEGSGMAAGGAIFLGYTIFAFFWWRRRLKKGA